MAACKSCGSPITWYRTETGGRMPVDPGPDPEGNVVIRSGLAVVTTQPEAGEVRRMPHWATCPTADEHRRPGRQP